MGSWFRHLGLSSRNLSELGLMVSALGSAPQRDPLGDFIDSRMDVNIRESREWMHFANLSKRRLRERWNEGQGRGILNALLSGGFSRTEMEHLIGRFGGKLDLRGVPLAKIHLTSKDLKNVDLYASDLSCADLSKSDLTASQLSEANIKGTKFDWCKMDDVILDNTEFDNKTSFLGVNVSRINFTLSALLYEFILTDQKIKHLQQRHPKFSRLLWVTSDYGRSVSRYAMWVVGIISLYAIIYYCFSLLGQGRGFIDSLYFSIVTFATVGYGDITPQGSIAKMVAVSEISLGYMMGGLLVAILSKRVVS